MLSFIILIISGLIVISALAIESYVYYQYTGDPLYRFHETERNYQVCQKWFFAEGSRFGWEEGSYPAALIKRLFIDGLVAIFLGKPFGLVTLTAILAIGYAIIRRKYTFIFPHLSLFVSVPQFQGGDLTCATWHGN